jgi:hypothetical protein
VEARHIAQQYHHHIEAVEPGQQVPQFRFRCFLGYVEVRCRGIAPEAALENSRVAFADLECGEF